MARTNKGKATHRLSDVHLDEISFVGKGDNPEAHVLLLKMKKDDGKHSIVALGKEFKQTDEQEAALKSWFDGAASILKDAMTFDAIVSNQEIKSKVWNLVYILEDSIASIMNDSEVTDKAALIQQSVNEFTAAITPIAKGGEQMSVELKKKLEETEATVTTLKSENEALKAEVATLKAAPKPGEKCPTCGQTATKKEGEEIDKSALPEAVRKHMEQQEADLKKQREDIEKMKDEGLTRTYVAKGVEVGAVGKAGEIGNVLKSIAKHDESLAGKVFDLLKTADTRIRTGELFKEAGSDNAIEGGASAYDKIVAKANELRKTKSELTPEQAFSKVFDSDDELRKQYNDEQRKK